MVVELYSMSVSVNCHGPWLLCKISGLDYVYKPVDLMKGEHMTPDFVEMNPKHCIPTIRDVDVEMWEGNAIMRYLCARYAVCAPYYPEDVAARAVCDTVLDFRQTTLYPHVSTLAYHAFGWAKADEASLEIARDAITAPDDGCLDVLCALLEPDKAFFCGAAVSIADFAIVPALKFLEVTDIELPPALHAYVQRFYDATPYQELASDVSSFISAKRKDGAGSDVTGSVSTQTL